MPTSKTESKKLIYFAASVLVFMGILLLPIDDTMKKVLAILVMFAVQLATGCVPNIVAALILAVLTIGMGLMPMGQFLSAFGSSPFIMVMCLLFLAEGARETKIGARLSYFLISKMGSSPRQLVLAFTITVTVLSIFIADIPATLIVMSVAINVLEACEEKKGGNLGKALAVVCCWGSITGGLGAISGSSANITAITLLETMTEGEFTVTFAQWAVLGIPFAFIMIFPIYWIICKYYKLKDYKIRELSKDEVQRLLEDLGPMEAAEKRYLAIMAVVIILFATSTQTGWGLPLISMFGMLLMIAPKIGVLEFKKASQKIAWDSLLLTGFVVAFSSVIVSSGMGQMVVDVALGWLEGYPVWFVIAFVAFVGFLLHFPFTCNPNGLVAVYVAAIVPLSASIFSDLHPAVLLMPAMFTGTAAFLNPLGTVFFLVHGFGYSKFKDPFLPGVLMVVPYILVLTVLSCLLFPLLGWL